MQIFVRAEPRTKQSAIACIMANRQPHYDPKRGMRLDAPLIRLPYRFDALEARTIASGLPEDAWQHRPDSGGTLHAASLIAADGSADAGRRYGRMQPAACFKGIPALASLLLAPGMVVGRTRLLRLATGGATSLKRDLDAYWHDRVRLVYVMEDGFTLHSGEAAIAAPAGTAWLVDGWRGWKLAAGDAGEALALMVDTVGSAAFWSLVASADRPESGDEATELSPRTVGLSGSREDIEALETETVRRDAVLPAAELKERNRVVLDEIREVAPASAPALARLEAVTDSFQRQWQAVLARHGNDESGHDARRQCLEQAWSQIAQFARPWTLANGASAAERFYWLVFSSAMLDSDGYPVEVVPAVQREQITGSAGTSPNAQAPSTTPKPALAEDYASETKPSDSEAPSQPATPGPAERSPQKPATAAKDQPPPDPRAPLRSVHTKSFPELLGKIGASLLVTTYQAGKLAILRENQGVINTHFQVYNRPMGLAADGGRLAVGTAATVEEYRNMADVAAKLDPPGHHDAAYLARNVQITGNIDIHEMAYGDDGLWLVNTRFSCLCTLDGEHSFVPRWRPKFISGYAPEDRCHLNGLEMVNGKPKYVTALGTSDTAGGWRDNKAGGGVLMDVDSGEFICRGLSMPHSPRYYDGKLWVLESGNGSLATVDPKTGQLDTVVELPGFTRGLDFHGPFAFIGLSQVRESAVFSGIRLTERVDERCCGVWVVDLRSAKIIAFLKFEDAVQEVFAVSVLPGQRYPDVLGINDPRVPISYALPEKALAEVVRPAAAAQAAGKD